MATQREAVSGSEAEDDEMTGVQVVGDLEVQAPPGKVTGSKLDRGEKRKASSPAVKEVDGTEEVRLLREDHKKLLKEVKEFRERMVSLEVRLKAKEKEIEDAERFFGDSGEGFQVVGQVKKGSIRQGAVTREPSSRSRAKSGRTGGKSEEKSRKVKGWFPDSEGRYLAIYEEVRKVVPEEKGGAKDSEKVKEKEKKESRNPPICFSRVDQEIAREILKKNEVDFKIQIGNEEARIITSGADNYRKVLDLLEKNHIEAHWHQRKDDRPLHAVVRHIPPELGLEEIKEDLEAKGIKVQSIGRMGSKKAPLDMVAVNTERSEEGRRIFSLNSVANYRVKVEPRRKPTLHSQCFRCLAFGHVQHRCTRREACAFCAGEHQSKDCVAPRGKGAEVTCVNCGGPHPAFFKSCPKNPEMVERKKEEDRRKKVLEAKVQPGVSYADRLKRTGKKEVRLEAVTKVREVSLEEKIEALIRKMVPDIVKALNG